LPALPAEAEALVEGSEPGEDNEPLLAIATTATTATKAAISRPEATRRRRRA
jgi:hypothetical protein